MSVTCAPLPEPAGRDSNSQPGVRPGGTRVHYEALSAHCDSPSRPELGEARTFVAQAQ